MKCPLMVIGWMINEQLAKSDIADCVQKECAWWDRLRNQCLAHSLVTAFDRIGLILAGTKLQMPTERQSRKYERESD